MLGDNHADPSIGDLGRCATYTAEIRQILAKAAADPPPVGTPEPVRLITVRTGVTSRWDREEIYGDAGR